MKGTSTYVLLGLAALGGWWWWSSQKKKAAAAQVAAAAQPDPVSSVVDEALGRG
jgi:LPXTG-motif cell wall-anchored protein